MVLGNLTDLCLTWTRFLVISGNLSSKCQRVWIQIRPTFNTRIFTELKKLISQWGRLSPAHLLMRGSRNLLPRKLQVCKVLGGGSIIFQVVHSLISMEIYIN